jgi:hypothetical protein
MRTIFAGAAMLLIMAPSAFAQTAPGGTSRGTAPAGPAEPPFHFRDLRTAVVIRNGNDLTVQPGQNDLGAPTTLNCRSAAGCELSIAVAINISQSTDDLYVVCTLVDGSPAKPQCLNHMYFETSTLQSLSVSQGRHVVETQFLDQGIAGVIGSWQVNYTLYENGQ